MLRHLRILAGSVALIVATAAGAVAATHLAGKIVARHHAGLIGVKRPAGIVGVIHLQGHAGKRGGGRSRLAGPASSGPITILGAPFGLLQPGGPGLGFDLSLSNGSTSPVSVTRILISVSGVSAPNATGSLTCSVADFTLVQPELPKTAVIPAKTTRTLEQLGVARAHWPQIEMLERPVNQDGCRSAQVTMRYEALSGQ